jgi:hypothetical protein
MTRKSLLLAVVLAGLVGCEVPQRDSHESAQEVLDKVRDQDRLRARHAAQAKADILRREREGHL